MEYGKQQNIYTHMIAVNGGQQVGQAAKALKALKAQEKEAQEEETHVTTVQAKPKGWQR